MINYHNDYEIINRIKEGDDEAYTLMVLKYTPLIKKHIAYFNLSYAYEDLYQEAIMLLYKLALKFDPSFNKTYTRLFEMSFQRYLITYLNTLTRRKHKAVTYQSCIAERTRCVKEPSSYFLAHLEEIRKILTPIEFSVYTLRELKNCAIDTICEEYNLSIKTVYNALHRAKRKIQCFFASD